MSTSIKRRLSTLAIMSGIAFSAVLTAAPAQADPDSVQSARCKNERTIASGVRLQAKVCSLGGGKLTVSGFVLDTADDRKCAQGVINYHPVGIGIPGRGYRHLATACGNGKKEEFSCTFSQVQPLTVKVSVRTVAVKPATRECDQFYK